MVDITDKVDFDTGPNGEYPASEFNDHNTEIQGTVEESGQTLNAGITDQFSQALFINGTAAGTVTVGGTADIITLTPVKGVAAGSFSLLDGALLRFYTTTPNTIAGVTINFDGLGAKDITNSNSADLLIGQLSGETLIRWDNSDDEWHIVSSRGEQLVDLVFEIGDWNMDVTTVLVWIYPTGIDPTNIRAINVMIRDDNGLPFSLDEWDATAGQMNGYWNGINAPSIQLIRQVGGRFDDPDFNSTSYNRGWITLKLVI